MVNFNSSNVPVVSVVMSVYNGATYLQEAIDSILNQTFTDFEFLIIEDGSTDNTLEILQNYARVDSRIRLIQNEQNVGLTKSLNKGLKLAQGKYIARQDADDVALPQRLAKQVEVFETQSNVVLVSCDLEFIDAAGNPLLNRLYRSCQSALVPWYLIFYNYIAGHSQTMFRRTCTIELGGYCETRRYSQDYELWCRLTKVGDVVILPEVLQWQRVHQESISAQKRLDQSTLSLQQVQRNIAELIKEEISLEEAADLRGLLMIPNDWYYFQNPQRSHQRTARLNQRFQEIYSAFLQQSPAIRSNPDLSQMVRNIISHQFFVWMQHLSGRKNPRLKLQVLSYAYLWSPLQTAQALFNLSKKYPIQNNQHLLSKPG